MRFLIAIGCGMVLGVGGCVTAPQAMPREFGQVVETLAQKMLDETVMDDFLARLDGHLQNPGLELFINNRLSIGGRFVGTNGNLVVDTSGTGTMLPAGVREALIQQLDGPLSDEQRAVILAILGWNRVTPEPG